MSSFRVALSADFRKADGSPSFPEFDLSPLEDHSDIDLFFLEPEPEISAAQLADVDALILLTPRVGAASLTPKGRLAVVARFGVGYDNVDLTACSAHDVAVVITPDGVRRPVAVSILTLIFALAGKLFVKDRLARRGPAGGPRRPFTTELAWWGSPWGRSASATSGQNCSASRVSSTCGSSPTTPTPIQPWRPSWVSP